MGQPTTDIASCSLILQEPSAVGTAMRMQAGDRLIAVNGMPLTGGPAKLTKRFAPPARPAVLTFVRGEHYIHMIADTIAFGPWEIGPAPAEEDLPARMSPDGFVNWEVYSTADGVYDVQPAPPSLLALVAPPLWLLQARLWGGFVAWAGITLAVLPAGWLAVAMAQVVMALYFWQAGSALFRSDRLSKGMALEWIIAARDEAALHLKIRELSPEHRFVYAPADREGEKTTETP